VDHHVVLARDQLVPIAVLSESVDIGSDGVGCTDQVQGTASPGLRITRVVIVQHALAGVNPETLRYQERSTERVLKQEVVVFIYNVSSIYSPR